MPKKNERGDPLASSGFVGYVKKVKNERGALCTKFALAGLGLSSLSSFISFCKKWYIRDEVCGLTKKKRNKKSSHCKSRALFPRKAPTKSRHHYIQGMTLVYSSAFSGTEAPDQEFNRKRETNHSGSGNGRFKTGTNR